MTGRTEKGHAAPSPDAAAAAPFFARFLEGQHGDDAGVNAGPSRMTLKYPSDRDEIDDVVSPARAESAATEAGPSRMTLKYPSDRDEDDFNYTS